MRRRNHSFLVLALLAIAFGAGAPAAEAQRDRDRGWGGGGGRGWNNVPPRRPANDCPDPNAFTFCRLQYTDIRREPLGHGWNTDYPESDINFMIRLSQLTTIPISRQPSGDPDHVVLEITDKRIFNYPFVFMSDVGTIGLSEDEVENLRKYLLLGGFLYVDDFWGEEAWEHWCYQIGRVLPPKEFQIFDISPDDEIMNIVFKITEVPQIPSIQHWTRSGGELSERGSETAEPHFRGIRDRNGRLIVVMTHNTDIADGWEREGENEEYFRAFSVKSYPLAINIVVYAMTH